MITQELESAVALFAADGGLHSVMSYGEFDAILFRAASLPDFANELVHAAYVTVRPDLQIGGAVFFLLRTDADGYVPSFTVPVDQLLRKATAYGYPSPPVVARSSCPDEEFAADLWQPVEASLESLAAAISANELGLYPEREQIEARGPAHAEPLPAPSLQGLLSELERARDEIHRLRSALRHEQDRNRRLQDALLGGRPAAR